MPEPAHQITAHMTVMGSDGLHVGASKEMEATMSETQLEDFASTKRASLPAKKS